MRRLGSRATVRRIRRHLAPERETVVVYFPRARLLPRGALGEALTVLYCPDDFRRFHDGRRDEAFIAWEDEALKRSDLVIGVSPTLCRILEARHPHVRMVENGFDPEVFRSTDEPAPEDVADLPRPRIGYLGTARMPTFDAELMAEAARRRPGWSFCVIGWYDAGDPEIERLAALPNVRILGPRPRPVLARYLAAMDAMTCPYPDCPVTPSRSPMKGYEALAAGRPLVATHSPILDAHRPRLRSTESLDEFLAALEEVLEDPPAGSAELAAPFTWSSRARELRDHILEALARRDPPDRP
jgi:glycosyltransferase involved in cell wall biosynthesis